ncbi:MAG: hypothetical protein LC772_05840, partial [Chloroflexi bacterium]|nr:hypothetical protein [Chloroflexota bacterium]
NQIERRECDPSPPMPSSRLSSARTFLSRQICSWIYGLYDRELAAEALPILWDERPWGGDAVFVFHLCLNYRVLGAGAGVLYKREGSGAQLQPPNKRSMAAWQVWYAGALLREVRKSSISLTSRMWLCLYLVRHFRRVAGGIINLVIVWVRAGIEFARGHRDFDAARTGH